jgi:hypothetical protein
LLARLEEARARHRAHAPIDPVAYDFEIGNLLWAFDALRDWAHGRAETSHQKGSQSMIAIPCSHRHVIGTKVSTTRAHD